MKINLNIYKVSAYLLLIMLLSYGCKEKGCTDPSAINFNSVADEDDGSCIICSSKVDTVSEVSGYMTDFNSGPHTGQNVALFKVYQMKRNYTSTACGSSGCYFLVSVESLVPETMSFNYSLQLSGNVSFSRFKNVNVLAHEVKSADSIPSNTINNPCGFVTSSSLFINASGTIFYQ